MTATTSKEQSDILIWRKIDDLRKERGDLAAQLAAAHDRIADMLKADDGQAWMETQRYIEENPLPDRAARLLSELESLRQEVADLRARADG